MRVTQLAVGLLVGGLLGFALHAWLADGGGGGGSAQPLRQTQAPSQVPPATLPGQLPRDSRPLTAQPAGAAAAPAGASATATADALVGILVHGAVLDTAGQPVPRNDYWLFFDDGRAKPLSQQITAESTYAASGLKPGQLIVTADLKGYRPFRTAITLSADQPVVRLDLVLEPAVQLIIKGFTPSGEPLVDAVVRELGGGNAWGAPRLSAIATREPLTGDLPEISHRGYDRWGIGAYHDRLDSSWNGTGDLPLDAMGRLELDESLPVFVNLALRHVLVATQRAEPGATEVVFTVPIESLAALLGTVRLRAVDAETGVVPEGVTADLSDSQSSGGGVKPDADGVFTWTKQRPGLLELEVRAKGYETWDQDVSVPAGGTADLGTIALTPETTISGVIVDLDGRPIGAGVQALRDDLDAGLGMGARRYGKSDVEGAFKIGALGRHRYRVVVSSEEWSALPVYVDASNGDVTGVRVTVERGAMLRLRPSWSVSDPYGLRITRKDGTLVSWSKEWRGDWAWTRRLPAGEYVVALMSGEQELKRTPVTLAADDVAMDVGP
jgi:hypothetical protein